MIFIPFLLKTLQRVFLCGRENNMGKVDIKFHVSKTFSFFSYYQKCKTKILKLHWPYWSNLLSDTWEAEAGGLWVEDQNGLHNKILPYLKTKTKEDNLQSLLIGKIGVPQKAEVKESAMSSYLSDLKSRDAVSSLPPVKRLKVSFNGICPLFCT